MGLIGERGTGLGGRGICTRPLVMFASAIFKTIFAPAFHGEVGTMYNWAKIKFHRFFPRLYSLVKDFR